MDIEKLQEQALAIYAENDSFAAIEFLLKLDDPKATIDGLIKVMKHQYWQKKDLVGALAFGRAGMQFGMQAALQYDDSDPELAHQLRCDAKGFAYDFASDAWVGWDEPGVEITSADHAAGRDAARMNLRLAVDLERGDLPVSRAEWLVGAYQLADAEYDAAIESFERAESFAEKADAATDVLLNQGYIQLTKVLASSGDESGYEAVKNKLKAVEHGDSFIQQLETARKVFSQ